MKRTQVRFTPLPPRRDAGTMLTLKPQLNLKNARGYFREHLAVGDYYTAEHVVAGEWRGAAATMLGLKGVVTEDAFLKLCDGLNPNTDKWLTARRKTHRRDGDSTVSNRRVFYDFTISPPKSVSVVALYQDARIVAVHDAAARVMLDAMEKFAETRVRRGGANTERVTGGVVGALFRHDTSRELDPHLHTHCILFNATYDQVEERWKALHATGMYRAQKFAQNLYYHELAKGLHSLGYEIENNGRDFEIKGVPDEVIKRFSKRHHQIDMETQKRIEAEGIKGNVKELRGQIAQEKRRRKIKSTPTDKLRPQWKEQMSKAELKALSKLTPGMLSQWLSSPPPPRNADIPDLLAWAERHTFERQSVTTDYDLLSLALARGRGEDFTLPQLEAQFESLVQDERYYREAHSRKITSHETLRRELAIVLAAEDGRKKYDPFNEQPQLSSSLSPEQRKAVTHILKSRDLITLFQGGAGTGKSFTLKEVVAGLKEIVKGLKEKGHPVVVATPQHQQANDLRRDGIGEASTLARVLVSGPLPVGAVVILDEAGQVGGKDMLALIEQVQASDGRLILSGDTRQHGAVAASDALRLIEKYTRLKPARLTAIRRQNPDNVPTPEEKRFVSKYRKAVKAASEGRTVDSFNMLDKLGCVRELDSVERQDVLSREYCAALDRKEKVLVVAQTWAEVREANAAIRERLASEGRLAKGAAVTSWQSLDLSEAQKQDARFYPEGSKVFFVRKYGRFKAGDACEIAGFNERGVELVKNGHTTSVGFQHAAHFIVAKSNDIAVAPGERLQMKFNGQSVDGKPIRNGELVTVQRVHKDGRIAVRDDAGVRKTLRPDQRLFVPGYAVTSYASQGKTVDTVLASYAGERMPANQNQWYVAISRAKKKVLVLTEDKEALRLCVEKETNRELALSLDLERMPPSRRPFPKAVQKAVELGQWAHGQAVMSTLLKKSKIAPDVMLSKIRQQLVRQHMQQPIIKQGKGVRR